MAQNVVALREEELAILRAENQRVVDARDRMNVCIRLVCARFGVRNADVDLQNGMVTFDDGIVAGATNAFLDPPDPVNTEAPLEKKKVPTKKRGRRGRTK